MAKHARRGGELRDDRAGLGAQRVTIARREYDAAVGLEVMLHEEIHFPRELVDVEGDSVRDELRIAQLGAAALQGVDEGHRLAVERRVLFR